MSVGHQKPLNHPWEIHTRLILDLLFNPLHQPVILQDALFRQGDLLKLASLVLVCPSIWQDDGAERRRARFWGKEYKNRLRFSNEDPLILRAAEHGLLPGVFREDVYMGCQQSASQDNVSALGNIPGASLMIGQSSIKLLRAQTIVEWSGKAFRHVGQTPFSWHWDKSTFHTVEKRYQCSYPSLGQPARQASPSLAYISGLVGVLKLPLALVLP